LLRDGNAAAYPFGFGLSYTTFVIGAVATEVVDDVVHLTVGARNTGTRPGTDVVQVYAVEPTRLVGFARVELSPGEARDVDIVIPTARLAVRDLDRHEMVVRPGPYDLRVARSAEDAGVAVSVEIRPSA
ncbi:MAG TPA: fibronectin type III-like domain-contianing protein, partial [Acidimicrobiales bacterium]|nr:fibronectin type III-like domain-contianing protein [Acidimicrobiales bacterium]